MWWHKKHCSYDKSKSYCKPTKALCHLAQRHRSKYLDGCRHKQQTNRHGCDTDACSNHTSSLLREKLRGYNKKTNENKCPSQASCKFIPIQICQILSSERKNKNSGAQSNHANRKNAETG